MIGTHRLLSKDIKFQDLGLVIVDEEHRFGVRYKERLKQLKKESGCPYHVGYANSAHTTYVHDWHARHERD